MFIERLKRSSPQHVKPTEIPPLEENVLPDWGRYRRFVTMLPGVEKPELILMNFSDHSAMHEPDLPQDTTSDASLTIDGYPSIGLAKLATQATDRGVSTGIFYGSDVAQFKNGKVNRLNPLEQARMIVSSGARSVGMSLVSGDLQQALMVIQHMDDLTTTHNIPPIRVIVGGPQASLDRERTAKYLGLDIKNVVQWRGEEALLQFLGKPAHFTELEGLFNPDFLILPKHIVVDGLVDLNITSTGGEACIGGIPCSFCTAFHLGPRRELPVNQVQAQIWELVKRGGRFTSIEACDNMINLALESERKRFMQVARYAHSVHIPIITLLSRPDIIIHTPDEVLTQLKEWEIKHVMMGIETGDPKTAIAMGRVKGGESAAIQYLNATSEACKKLRLAGIDSHLSVVLGYPLQGQNTIEADQRTFLHLGRLIHNSKIPIKYDGDFRIDGVSISMSPVLPFPGSQFYRDLIERGATPDSLDAYVQETSDLWYEAMERMTTRGDDPELRVMIMLANSDLKGLQPLLDCLQERRNKLNSLLKNPY